MMTLLPNATVTLAVWLDSERSLIALQERIQSLCSWLDVANLSAVSAGFTA